MMHDEVVRSAPGEQRRGERLTMPPDTLPRGVDPGEDLARLTVIAAAASRSQGVVSRAAGGASQQLEAHGESFRGVHLRTSPPAPAARESPDFD